MSSLIQAVESSLVPLIQSALGLTSAQVVSDRCFEEASWTEWVTNAVQITGGTLAVIRWGELVEEQEWTASGSWFRLPGQVTLILPRFTSATPDPELIEDKLRQLRTAVATAADAGTLNFQVVERGKVQVSAESPLNQFFLDAHHPFWSGQLEWKTGLLLSE